MKFRKGRSVVVLYQPVEGTFVLHADEGSVSLWPSTKEAREALFPVTPDYIIHTVLTGSLNPRIVKVPMSLDQLSELIDFDEGDVRMATPRTRLPAPTVYVEGIRLKDSAEGLKLWESGTNPRV